VQDDPRGQKVVVAYLDKKRDRGYVRDFKPFGEGFTLVPAEDGGRGPGRFIEFRICKAVYFVKSLEGNKEFKENKLQLPPVTRQGRKLEVAFHDGERIVGITEGFLPGRPGFTFFPPDPGSNNIEIFVVTSNVEMVRLIGGGKDGTDVMYRPDVDKGVFVPEKRLEAVQRVLKGEPLLKVAKEMYIPPDTLAGWKARFLSGGPAALGVTKPADGAPPGRYAP